MDTLQWPFLKMQGLGNDFILMDLRDPAQPAALHPQAGRLATAAALAAETVAPELAALSRRLCDRHFGIGADGLLLILPSARAAARMRVLNTDGSEAEMCGNGLRCVAWLLHERARERTAALPLDSRDAGALAIETGAGVLSCTFAAEPDGALAVEVAMGRPRFRRTEIPVLLEAAGEEMIAHPLPAGDRTFALTAVSMGNPHAVILLPQDEPDVEGLARRYGPLLEQAACFPQRANVSFARFRGPAEPGVIDLWVWERGCGLTLACGTGACATAAAAWRLGRLSAEAPLRVHLPGGALQLRVAHGGEQVYMRGPAVPVFSGTIALPPA